MELKDIKGVGDKMLSKLGELDINNIEDLYKFLPRNYLDMTHIVNVMETVQGEYSLIQVYCTSCAMNMVSKSHLKYVRAVCESSGHKINLLWFNMPYMSKSFGEGDWLIWGKVEYDKGTYTIINPSFDKIENKYKLKDVVPIYPLKGVIGAVTYRKIMEECLNKAEITNQLPELFNLDKAYQSAHFPMSVKEMRLGHYTLAMYDIVMDLVEYRINRQSLQVRPPKLFSVPEKAINRLKFKLTASQINALDEILADMSNTTAMNRLLLGDVGSGKTIVAQLAMLSSISDGGVAVMLAPTEILCTQHYNNCKALFGDEYKIGILTGSISKKDRKNILEELSTDKIKLLFATHSCLSDDVQFNNLKMVVIDESHKFGVSQKGIIHNKGEMVDLLIMSATPVPRTFAMTLYGDLKISVIDRRNENIDNVKTYIFGNEKIEKMYSYICSKANDGEQIYLVCPKLNDNDGKELYSAKGVYKHLISNYIDANKVGLIFGSMKDKSKQDAMKKFANGETNILVATTVVEVGIDVNTASTIVILASDCFGLASLHQLRGRVGRNGKPAECFLHIRTSNIPMRIKCLKDCNDGIELAKIDAEIRGYGDIIGYNQSGKSGLEKYKIKVTLGMVKRAKAMADTVDLTRLELNEAENDTHNMKNIVLN